MKIIKLQFIELDKFQFVELNSIYPIGARLKYILLLFIGYSPKMNKKVIYAYQYLSNTETKIMSTHIDISANHRGFVLYLCVRNKPLPYRCKS